MGLFENKSFAWSYSHFASDRSTNIETTVILLQPITNVTLSDASNKQKQKTVFHCNKRTATVKQLIQEYLKFTAVK